MLSVYFAVLGLGALGLGLGLLVQGPLALDRKWVRQRSDSEYVKGGNTIDLHADRDLGDLEGDADAIWRPIASVHFWTSGAVGFGLVGVALTAAALPGNGALGGAIAAGLTLGYAVAWTFRALPARPKA